MENKTNNLKEKISENGNYAGFIIVIFVYIAFSIIGNFINEESLSIYKSYTAINWLLFVSKPALTAVIGTTAKAFLKQQGVIEGLRDPVVEKVYEEWVSAHIKNKSLEIPDDYKAVMVKGSVLGAIKSMVMTISMSLMITVLSIDFSISNMISLIITLSMWVSFGFSDKDKMFNYIRTKQLIRMKYEIEQINNENQNGESEE